MPNNSNKSDDNEPIALSAYQQLAQPYFEKSDTKAHNAYYERPATMSLLPDVAGRQVLDLACGPGWYGEQLLKLGAVVTCCDITPNMLEITRNRLGGRAKVVEADLDKRLPFDDESFDVAIAPLVADYLKDVEFTFSEVSRVLKPGGVFVFSAGHPFFDFRYTKSENYFATEYFVWTWWGFGEPVDVPGFRRPLSEYTEGLFKAGFVMERLIEPKPTEKFKELEPEDYEKLTHFPGFMCIRANKIK